MNGLYNLLELVVSEYDARSTEHHIASVMLENIYQLAHVSIGELARMCNVSKSTMSKFVRDMGFDDYKDFRLEAGRLYVKEKYGHEDTNINITDFIISKGDSAYLDVLKQDLDLFFQSIDREKIEKLAVMIHDYPRVAAFGDGYSECFSRNLQYKMTFYRKTIYTTRSSRKQVDYIETAGEDTLIIVFSNRGGYMRCYQGQDGRPEKECFKHTKGKIFLITSNEDMVNDPLVDECILYEHTTIVQNHLVIYQMIIELLAVVYQEKYGFPEEII
ncbi:MAG TPA: MurR/RpiR family transcriptional regulator [Candidatus Mediterraneibacter vanvlietii]|nr:MurR/RpiR family transcriptional regulator [Candidatus Mediterraneibacter vanvlietii]